MGQWCVVAGLSWSCRHRRQVHQSCAFEFSSCKARGKRDAQSPTTVIRISDALCTCDAAPESSSGSNVAAIAGGVGGVGCVLLIIGAVILRKTFHKLAPPVAGASASSTSPTAASLSACPNEPAATSASDSAPTAACLSANEPTAAGESTRAPAEAAAVNLANELARSFSTAQKVGEGSESIFISVVGESAVELAKEVGQVALPAKRLHVRVAIYIYDTATSFAESTGY